jgi:hypothetical protein
VKKFRSEDKRTGMLQDLTLFVMKSTKERKDLENERSELLTTRGEDLSEVLSRFALML